MPRDGEKRVRKVRQKKLPVVQKTMAIANRTVAPLALPAHEAITLTGRKYVEDLEYAFPDVAPPYVPLGTRILVQLRTPGSVKTLNNGTKFFLPDETVDYEKMTVQTALVRQLGPAAFKNRATMQNWPEGDWCVPGEFVRIPKFGGDRVAVQLNDENKREVIFMTMEDRDVIGLLTLDHDPLAVKQVV